MIFRIVMSITKNLHIYLMWRLSLNGFIPTFKIKCKHGLEINILWLYIYIIHNQYNQGLMIGTTFLSLGIGVTSDVKK